MSGIEFLAADWPAPEGVIAGTTLRTGGVSSGVHASLNLGAHVDDRAENVVTNRDRLMRHLELPAEPGWLRQVHGNEVVRAPLDTPEPQADAAITETVGVVCAVMTADCLPVLFARRDGGAVAAAHAGWRGLGAGVLEATVEAFGDDPGQLMAWMGPAISQPAFEVGAEVREQFVARDPSAAGHFVANPAGRWQADLYGLARQRLSNAGLRYIYGGDRCTFAEPEAFFSHRRDGQCGRMTSVIFRRDEGQ